MGRTEIEGKVIGILKSILKSDAIQADTPLLGKQGIMDSVTVVQFIRQLEKEFQIRFDDDDLELEWLVNPGTVVNLVISYTGLKLR